MLDTIATKPAATSSDVESLVAITNAHRVYIDVLLRHPWAYRATSIADFDETVADAVAHQRDLELACLEAQGMVP